MATQVYESLICDMHGDTEVEAVQSNEFEIAGQAYKIDLCETHQAQFMRAFTKFTEHAEELRGSGGKQRGNARRGNDTDPAAIRDWARTKGMKVAERGRIPSEIVDAYKQAHKTSNKHHAAA